MPAVKQLAWLAILKGMGIGLLIGMVLIIFIAVIRFTSLPDRRGAEIEWLITVAALLFYGLPLMLLFGGLFGWCFLGNPRPWYQAWLLVGASTLLLSSLTFATGLLLRNHILVPRFRDYQLSQKDQRTPRIRLVNLAPHSIANATLLPFEHLLPINYHGFTAEYPPLTADSSTIPDIRTSYMVEKIPQWNAQMTLQVFWARPRQGRDFKHAKDPQGQDAGLADYVELSATAHLPPYQGVKNKVFTVFFLPDDQVCVVALDLNDPNPTQPPTDKTHMARGSVVLDED